MNCPQCHQENSGGTFCRFCGTRLPVFSSSSPLAPAPEPERFCTECGAPRDPGAGFCDRCGHRFTESLPSAAPQVAVQPAPKSRSPLLLAIAGTAAGLVLLVSGLGAAWFLTRDTSPTAQPVASAPTGAAREAAFRHFTQGMEQMERFERGQGNENTLMQALEHAEQATQLDPSAAVYWHLLGHIYAQMPADQMASVLAEDALNKAIRLNPGNAASRLLLARLLLGRESYALALDQLESVTRQDAKKLTPLLVADMCRAYVVDEQARRGEAFFREARQQRPELSALRLGLAILLHEQGRTQAGLTELQGLLADPQASPDDVAYARQLAQAWQGARS